MPRLVLPSHEDPLVAEVSGILGGPVGRHARLGGRRFWIPVRVCIALAVVMGCLGWSEKSTCLFQAYAHEYQYTRACYTDVFVLYGVDGLSTGSKPYIDQTSPHSGGWVEYPVLIGASMYAVASAVNHWLPVHERYAGFFDLTALLLGVALVVVVAATCRTSRGRPWDGAMIALAPAMLLNLDVNWDIIAAAFTALGLLAWSRRRPVWAGVWLGLGVATKFYPVFLLVPLFALCLRSGRLRAFLLTVRGGVASWLVVSLPIAIASPHGFGYFYKFSERRSTEYNSIWYALSYAWYGTSHLIGTSGSTGRAGLLNDYSGVLFAAALVAIVVLALVAPERPRLGQLAFLTIASFVLTNKVYSPQYVVWLIPLAVLARPRWRYFLVWQLSEVIEFITLYGFLVYVDTSGSKGVPYWFTFFLGIAPRDLILIGLMGLVVREAWNPFYDIVRSDGVDDPAGGVLDGAPDRFRFGPGYRPRRSLTNAISAA